MVYIILYLTLKTGMPVEEGDSILKLMRSISRPEIQLGVGFYAQVCDMNKIKMAVFTVLILCRS